MRKKILPLVAIATMLFFVACNNEDNLPEAKPETGNTITFAASMPDVPPSTRVNLEEDSVNSINLTWDYSDTLKVSVVQGNDIAIGIATINQNSIINNGKNAIFSIPNMAFPEGEFDFYGVYGGGGLSPSDPTKALLPANPSVSGSLQEVQDNKDVMLYFSHEGVSSADLNNGVTFKHLGSLFKITLKNNCTTGGILNLSNAQLDGVNNPNGLDWAYDFNTTGTLFDLTDTTKFLNTGTGINSIFFTTNTL